MQFGQLKRREFIALSAARRHGRSRHERSREEIAKIAMKVAVALGVPGRVQT